MTAVVFPTYFLARTIVGKPAALFAATATAAVPALAYSQVISEEALAYPYAALCFFLIAKAIVARTRWWIAGAVVACLVAPLVRAELGVIAVAFALAAFFYFLTSDAGRRWRASWTAWDWVGAVVLTTGAIVFFSAVAGNFSQSWLIATGYYRGRMIEYGVWAGGAFVIGLGVLPVVAALAGLVRPKDEERTPALRAFTALLLAALLCFGLYTAVKASYLSTSFGTVIVERNLIYLIPLVFVGTALWLERPRLRWIPLAAATAFVAYLLVSANYALENVPYSDALGLAIAQMSNRNLSFTDNAVQWALIVTLAVSVLLLVLPRLLGARRDGGAGRGRRDGRARPRLDAHGPDLRREVLERLGRPHHAQLPEAAHVARRHHRRRAGRLPRPEHQHRRRAGHLADGVLEPLAEARVEPRRHGARARPGADARPRGHGRPAGSRPGRALRARRAGRRRGRRRSSGGRRRPAAGSSTGSTGRCASRTPRRASSSTAGWARRARTTSTRRRAARAGTWS